MCTSVTKHQVLKCVAATFDPFDLTSPVVLIGRIFLQQITWHKVGWEQEVPVTAGQPSMPRIKEFLIFAKTLYILC